VKILIDECLAPTWTALLNASGFEASYWSEIGTRGEQDIEILHWARENSYVILTRDLDFSDLIAWHGLTKPSIVQLRTGDSLPDKGTGELVVSFIRSATEALEHGAIITIHVEKKKARIKLLMET